MMNRGVFMSKRRFGKKKRRINRTKVILVLLSAMLLYTLFLWNFTVSPNIEEISGIKTKSIISQATNSIVRSKFSTYASTDDLLIIRTNTAGEIEMVQANTSAINSVLGHLYRDLRTEYSMFKPIKMDVPIGSILGSEIFSQTGPSIDIKVQHLAVSSIDFRTEFESQGINQTKYKVYAIFNTEAMVLSPFSSKKVAVSNTILVAETVILGRVPQSFVNVPETSILDGMNTSE